MEAIKLKELIFLLPRDDNGTLWPFTISEGVHRLQYNRRRTNLLWDADVSSAS